MNDSRNDSGTIHGTAPERYANDSPLSRAPADQGIKGAGIKGVRTAVASGLTGSSSTREQSQPQQSELDESNRWLVAIRRDLISRTVTLAGFNPTITELLRGKPWAALDRERGWTIPMRYLAHVERMLAAAGVDLFDPDGNPTPAQQEQMREDERTATRRVLDELRAAREASEADARATEQARRAARKAFADAIAARKGEPA